MMLIKLIECVDLNMEYSCTITCEKDFFFIKFGTPVNRKLLIINP